MWSEIPVAMAIYLPVVLTEMRASARSLCSPGEFERRRDLQRLHILQQRFLFACRQIDAEYVPGVAIGALARVVSRAGALGFVGVRKRLERLFLSPCRQIDAEYVPGVAIGALSRVVSRADALGFVGLRKESDVLLIV